MRLLGAALRRPQAPRNRRYAGAARHALPTLDVGALAGLFALSGTLHLTRPVIFEPLVPPWLPGRRALVYLSGAAEIGCALGLFAPRTRRLAGWASAALLVAVFPGNIQMAVDAHRKAQRTGRHGRLVATVLRLPLQVPLIRVALKAARG